MIERDKRAVLIANNFFKSQLFFNKSYALRSVGTSEGVTCCAGRDRKSTRLNSSHEFVSRMPSSA